jgi:hypothetical protein
MAKYEIIYACGHKGTVNLDGKSSEHKAKIAWIETKDCWKCKKDKNMAKVEADETPVSIMIKYSSRRSFGNSIYLLAIATGGTYREKENLKSLGFQWRNPRDTGFFDFLSGEKNEKCWNKLIKLDILDVVDSDSISRAAGIIDGKLGLYPASFDLSYSDIKIFESIVLQEEEEKAEKAKKEAQEESNARSRAAFEAQQQRILDTKREAKARYRASRAKKKAEAAAIEGLEAK